MAALGCTCGFERWPKREARALLNLLLDVTEGAFVRRQSEASPTGLQTGFPLDISVVRWYPFDSFIFKGELLFESGTFLGRRGDRFLLLDICVAGITEDQRSETFWVLFLPVGTWRHAFLGTAAECLIPSAPWRWEHVAGQCDVSFICMNGAD